MPADWLLLALGAAVGGFVQGLSGFAFSMVAMSFWVWGVEPQAAVVMGVFGGVTGQLLAALRVKRGLSWQVLGPMLAGGVVGVPIGVWLLPQVDANLFKLACGIVLVLWCPAMLFARNLPRVPGNRAADALVGLGGGTMSGISGFAGVMPSLWCTLRGFDKDLQRTTVQNFNLAVLAMTLAGMLMSGVVTREMLPMFAIVAPALVLPALLGARIYLGMAEITFRRVVLVLLTASGLVMIASALPRLLA